MGLERFGAVTSLSGALLTTALLAAVAMGSTETSTMPAYGQPAPVEITFLDVGQGDAVLVRAPGGEVLMVDAGPEAPLRALSRLGVDSIGLLVATHAHADHIGGMQGILTARPVQRYLSAQDGGSSGLARGVDATVGRLTGVTRLAAEGQRLGVGDLTVEVLPTPPRAQSESASPPSIGLLVRYGDFVALFPGDAEEGQLGEWTEAGLVPDVALLKAAHHGSESGVTVSFVEAARPELVVISVGEENRHGHPRPEALTVYGSVASRVLRTDVHGHITVRGFPDGSYQVLTGSDLDDLRPLDQDPSSPEEPPFTYGTEAPGVRLGLAVTVNASGARSGDLNRDYGVIVNRGDDPVDLSGWRLCDLSTRCFRFPPDTSVRPGRRVVVYTGYGIPDGASFFMNNDRRVWNEDGDEAFLYDADGWLVLRHVY